MSDFKQKKDIHTMKSLQICSDRFEPVIRVVLDAVQSENTRFAYRRALTDFITWYEGSGERQLTKSVVRAYVAHLQDTGTGAHSINQRLAAIRKLCNEAADNGALSAAAAAAIGRVENIEARGGRLGTWLSKRQVEQILNGIDTDSLKGKRDKAIMAVFFMTGLRRSEIVNLRFENISMVESRWIFKDLVLKRNHTHSTGVPAIVVELIHQWAAAAGISSGFVFRRVRAGDHLAGDRLTSQALYDLVQRIAGIACHDCRRTFAGLADKGGASLESIQQQLGHSSQETTRKYLKQVRSLADAACDHLGLALA